MRGSVRPGVPVHWKVTCRSCRGGTTEAGFTPPSGCGERDARVKGTVAGATRAPTNDLADRLIKRYSSLERAPAQSRRRENPRYSRGWRRLRWQRFQPPALGNTLVADLTSDSPSHRQPGVHASMPRRGSLGRRRIGVDVSSSPLVSSDDWARHTPWFLRGNSGLLVLTERVVDRRPARRKKSDPLPTGVAVVATGGEPDAMIEGRRSERNAMRACALNPRETEKNDVLAQRTVPRRRVARKRPSEFFPSIGDSCPAKIAARRLPTRGGVVGYSEELHERANPGAGWIARGSQNAFDLALGQPMPWPANLDYRLSSAFPLGPTRSLGVLMAGQAEGLGEPFTSPRMSREIADMG